MVRGEPGDGAVVTLNDKIVGMSAPIVQNDIIQIKESTVGADAVMTVGKLAEYKSSVKFKVNDKEVICPKYVMANHQLVSDTYSIQQGDELEILNYYTLGQLLEFMDLPYREDILVNNQEADETTWVYENFSVIYPLTKEADILELPEETSQGEVEAAATTEQGGTEEQNIIVFVNDTKVIIPKKVQNILVDVLDSYPFDLTVAKGDKVVIKHNGEVAEFTTPIHAGDQISLYWE